ncbi:HD-GYP domain-containing protein [Deefgea rivuli]|uniref:HD-GYP domain-containing protein n=1 Tax=Deefgea rivuli TaxID=400948 RepID=UPI00055DCB9B|nr:HD-GYP domain-containing protein [Deefgea rivuli]
MTLDETAHFIHPDQLQIGLFIHLDLHWMEHPFTFGSFKIKSIDQIDTLKKLGLSQIRYSPTKSDAQPLAVPIATIADITVAEPEIVADPALLALLAAKRQRLEQHERRQTQLAACEKEFGYAAKVVRNISSQIHTQPKETVAAADQLVGKMLDSLLSDSDIAIHLMNGKVAGDDNYFHSLNVSVLALMLAREMKLSREQIHTLGLATLFHDIGKSEVPDRILLKTDGLNRAEQAIIEQHCQWGVEAGHRAGLDVTVLKVIAQHHELCDGSGYPHRLSIDKIDPLARIVSLVNTYDNYCNKTNPAQSLTPHEGLALMFAHQKAKFDPVPLNHFIKCLGVYPPGTLVMLSNECYGLVVSVNASRPLKPQVLVYDNDNGKSEAVVLDLEFEKGLNISKSLKIAQLPRDVALYLAPKKRMTYFFSPSEPV